MKRRLLFILSLMVAITCTTATAQKADFATKKPFKHVILVGYDGMSSHALNAGANMPTLSKLMQEGAHTTEARCILPSSSACNWASMFMGASSEIHGYNTWGSRTPDLPSRELNKNGVFPNMFSEYREASPSSRQSVFYQWEGIRYIVDTMAVDHLYQSSEQDLVDKAKKELIDNKPSLMVVSFDQPDGIGHKFGWESTEYLDKLTQLDGYLKQIVDAIDEAGIKDNTLLIVTSDHGGIENGHGGITMKEMQVPVVLWGKGVKSGYKIEDSVMIYDIAATILSAKHVQKPQVWIGRSIDSAFGK